MPFANNNGVRIHYEVEGYGPPLMLHHGFSDTWEMWRQAGYAQELSQEYRLIMLDARGCGASDKPHAEQDYDFRFRVGDLVAVLDDLNVEKANYFGYSLGGKVGFRIPIYAPQRFRSLILGGAIYPLLGIEDAQSALTIAIARRFEKEAHLAGIEKQPVPGNPGHSTSMLPYDAWALLASARALLNAVSPKSDEVLPNVNLPCLIFAGEADPYFVDARECAKRIPNAVFFSLPGLSHMQAIERSGLTLPHIKKFLAEVNKK
jgi:pimeloyl-ACP methyl ester carboxylesterase